MGSGAVIYAPSLIKIGSGVKKLMGGGYTGTHTHGQQRDLISLLYFFQNKESRLTNSDWTRVCLGNNIIAVPEHYEHCFTNSRNVWKDFIYT
jgi:hypothetical protein